MNTSRAVTWEGFYNTRDLGGQPTRSGHATRYGAFFRAADLRFVTDKGWSQARQSGVRTIVDLRNADEIRLATVPLDDIEDTEFWRHINGEQLNGSPLYSCRRWPMSDRRPSQRANGLSTEALKPLFAVMGAEDQGPIIQSILTDRGTTTQAAILSTLEGLDVERYLIASGVSNTDLDGIRKRLLNPDYNQL
ncbi:tyrosine-protein phosphatase [Amycolatopsis japonica]|uniref:tyrosine-protein phosphatase n=1 Tax=Amycolatopsis japonica TaxID=208439 RepID=UPI00331D8A9F